MGRNGLKWVILESFSPKKAVTRMLMGEYDYAIDEKGRLNFPAKFREEMGESFVVARWLDNCLVAYPTEKWQEQAEHLKALAGIKNRLIVSYLFASGVVVQPDKQGRILLPGGHREHAKLSKEVTIIGVGDHAEIWNTQAWHEAMDTVDNAKLEAALLEMGL